MRQGLRPLRSVGLRARGYGVVAGPEAGLQSAYVPAHPACVACRQWRSSPRWLQERRARAANDPGRLGGGVEHPGGLGSASCCLGGSGRHGGPCCCRDTGSRGDGGACHDTESRWRFDPELLRGAQRDRVIRALGRLEGQGAHRIPALQRSGRAREEGRGHAGIGHGHDQGHARQRRRTGRVQVRQLREVIEPAARDGGGAPVGAGEQDLRRARRARHAPADACEAR